MSNFLIDNWVAFTGVVGSVFTFLAGRKTAKITESNEQTNAVKNIAELYDKFTQDSNSRFDEMSKEILELKFELDTYDKKVKELIKSIVEFEKENVLLKSEKAAIILRHKNDIAELTEKHNQDIETLRKKHEALVEKHNALSKKFNATLK